MCITNDPTYAAFADTRRKQLALDGRTMTPTDVAMGDLLFEVATGAMRAVAANDNTKAMRVVCAATGLGKSRSAYAFIAAHVEASQADASETFTAAYVAPTVEMCIEAQRGIEALLGEGTTTLWSSYHDAARMHQTGPQEAARKALGYIPTRLVQRSTMRTAKVVIGTHHQLVAEMRDGANNGIRKVTSADADGNPVAKWRDVVFVDENADLIAHHAIKPGALQSLHDNLAVVSPAHDWLPLLSRMVGTMSNVMQSTGQTYEPVALLDCMEGVLFATNTREDIDPLVDLAQCAEKRAEQQAAVMGIVDFIRAAASGCAFYSRNERVFVGYRLLLTNDYPGLVLLDATADLSGTITLSPHVAEPRSISVDYSPLELFSVYLPAEFRGMTMVMGSKESAEKYGEWVKATVLANTQPGDDVLIIAHKDPVRLGFIPVSEDPDKPTMWDGRLVGAETWGDGVGLNKWRNKGVVFTFGDHFMPRSRTVAEVHAYSGLPLTVETLKMAEGVKIGDGEYAPRGPYRRPYDGVRMRWLKQLSMRGSARLVDAEGRCGSMRLYTSATQGLLLKNLDKLFPGCRPPQFAKDGKGVELAPAKMGGRAKLIDLMRTTTEILIGADMVQRVSGVPTSKLAREFTADAVQTFARCYGWTLVKAKEVGKAGRMLYLYRDPKFALGEAA